jgi:hypothetical protein
VPLGGYVDVTARRPPGRPRSKFPAAVLAELGAPPIGKPLQLMAWYHATLARVSWLRMSGQIPGGLAEELRADARAAASVMPHAAAAELERMLRDEQRDKKREGGAGPPTEPADGTSKPLRKAPR